MKQLFQPKQAMDLAPGLLALLLLVCVVGCKSAPPTLSDEIMKEPAVLVRISAVKAFGTMLEEGAVPYLKEGDDFNLESDINSLGPEEVTYPQEVIFNVQKKKQITSSTVIYKLRRQAPGKPWKLVSAEVAK